ncbi:tRNA(Ile)-lysidine synthase [Bacteroidota bacterium]|nr:tRNA(Ile)-lysidine synthase [Bacteroidota bacterium]
MINQFKNFIQSNQLFSEGIPVLAGVSGGVDSMVLVNLFSLMNQPFAIAHCNFQLRGDESNADEKFVKELASTLKVECFTEQFDTKEVARTEKISIQMAARNLRYDWLEKIRKQNGFHFIATAHHRDDSIETVLMNLIKGTGIRGLHGILPKQGKIIRPLLFTGKNEIRKFALENKIAFREDSSNIKTVYERNLIRHKVIPLMEEINPSFKSSFENSIRHFVDAEALYELSIANFRKKLMKQKKSYALIDIPALLNSIAIETILFELLQLFGFEEKSIEQIFNSLKSESGKEFLSSTHRIIKDRKKLFIVEKELSDSEVFLIEKKKSQTIPIGENKIEIRLKEASSRTKHGQIELDADKISFPLILRKWKSGDYFYPTGMKMKKKKLSNFFVDLKIPLHEKENQFVLQDTADKIICVVGLRGDERFALKSFTKNFITIKI